jgi:RNA polymerase sigma-70 factor (ECF subfamily)
MVVSNLPSFIPSPRPTGAPAEPDTESQRAARHDALLVSRFNSGDESAFAEIVARYREKLFAIAFGLLRNRADAEEIAQDALVRAHRALAHFRGDASLATWLHRIALNLARNRYWYHFRRCQHTTLPLDAVSGHGNGSTFAELIASDAPSPAHEVATSELAEIISLCTEQMAADQREILTLRNVHHRSYREIARTLGVKIGTVKSRIGRARRQLRLKLADTYPEFHPDASLLGWFEPIRAAARHSSFHT